LFEVGGPAFEPCALLLFGALSVTDFAFANVRI
jgi:hypothetical protein